MIGQKNKRIADGKKDRACEVWGSKSCYLAKQLTTSGLWDRRSNQLSYKEKNEPRIERFCMPSTGEKNTVYNIINYEYPFHLHFRMVFMYKWPWLETHTSRWQVRWEGQRPLRSNNQHLPVVATVPQQKTNLPGQKNLSGRTKHK